MATYDPWRDHLLRQKAGKVVMSFDELDALAPLPPSARLYTAWWNNEDPAKTTHTQCKSWQAAGYTARTDITRGIVTFTRKT